MKKFWPFSFFFLIFAAIAAYMPYLVLYFQSLGFSGPQIGFITGISPLVTLVAVPIWTRTADKTNRHRILMSISLLVGMAGLAIFPMLGSFTAVLVVSLIISIFFAPVLSFGNSATMYMLGDEKDLYGRIRVGGTIGFGITAFVVGILVDDVGLRLAFWLAAGLIFLCFLVTLQLVYGKEEAEPNGEESGGLRDLLLEPNWIFFLILSFIGGLAFAVGNSYFFPYMSELGMEESAMGLALTLGTIAEIPVMFLANWFINRFNAYGTLLIALAFTGLRLALFGIIEEPFMVMVIQILNGLTIPLLMVAGVSYADQLSPENLRTTGQGLFNAAMLGIGAAAGGFIGGLLLTNIGGQSLYLVTGLAVLIILGIVILLRNRFTTHAKSVQHNQDPPAVP